MQPIILFHFSERRRPAAFACDSTAVLDGFTLSGAAEAAMLNSEASPTVRNCIFTATAVVAVRPSSRSGCEHDGGQLRFHRQSHGIRRRVAGKVLGNFAELLVLQKSFHARGRSHQHFWNDERSGYVRIINCMSPITMPALTAAVWNRRALSPTKSETAFLENRDGALATKSEKSQVISSMAPRS